MGRKGKMAEWICPDGLEKVSEWAKSGLVEEQIAHNMGIALSTLYSWKNKFPELMTALKKNKAIADEEVENALFKSACGYYVEETVSEGVSVARTVRKWIKPDTAAQIFWLKNRNPIEWRDKVAQEPAQEDNTLNICIIPSQHPVAPPPDITDRDEIIKYYENQFNADDKDYLEEYGN